MELKAKMIELSQDEVTSSGYLIAKFAICDFDPNRNNVQLNRQAKNVEEMIKTLDGMPLVGKILVNDNGELDFRGHEVSKELVIDKNGNEFCVFKFNTEAFGSFYDTKIENIDGKEIITSMCKIWTRFEEACEIIIRLFKEDRMEVSWEVSHNKKHFSIINGQKIKVLDQFWFEGVCLLGETVEPAYKNNAYMLDLSSLNEGNEIAQALIKDINKINKNGGNENMGKDLSSLTMNDLYEKIRNILNGNSYRYYISIIYPDEKRVIYFDWEREKESDYFECTYTIENDEVVLSKATEVEMIFKTKTEEKEQSQVIVQLDETAKLLSTKETELNKCKNEISELKTKVSEQADGILNLNKEIENKDNEISELKPFKEKVEEMEKAQKEKELSERKEKLKNFASQSGFITKEEIETSEEIQKLINDVDESGIKCLIADRVMAQKENNKEKEVETSTIKTDITNTTESVNIKSYTDIVDNFLFK